MTVFTRIFHTQGDSLVELSAWIENVRNGQWKNEVENYRRLMAEGKKQEAASVKEQLPALVPAGNCLRGRYPKCLTNRTGYAMFDMDKMPPDVLRNAFARLKEVPWVAACHVTVSGTGLRIFVCIGVVHPDVYRRAYEIVAHALEQVAGHPCDMQCKDLCRLTLASYDPEAYLAPEPLTFPYEEGNNPLLYQPATGTDSSEDYRFNGRNAGNSGGPAPGNMPGYTPQNAGNASGPAPGNMPGYAPGNPADYASGNAGFRPFGIPEDPNDDCRYVPLRDPEAFLANFFRKNKFQEGQRHNVLLRLGRNIRWRRFNPYDFERLKHSAFRMMGQLTYSEYCSAMDWGYNHADLGPWVHMDPNGPSTVRKESDEDDLMSHAPLFPEWIYDKLPPLIRRGIIAARSGRQRDMLLMSILTNLSGCVPLVRTLYAHRLYSPHFFFAAVAPAGSGKGVVALSALLGSKIHREMEENNRRERKEYEQKMLEWEAEQKRAFREKRKPDISLKPEEPRWHVLNVPPNTSKSQLMTDLYNSGEIGIICNTTEIDSFTAALGTDYGKHASELRMIYHHEAVGQNYKIDGHPILIQRPRMAICMAGTLQQLVNFVSSKEDGMYSRLALLTGKGESGWISAAPDSDDEWIDGDELFENLADDVLQTYHFLLNSPTSVHFTREQWKIHNKLFGHMMRNVSLEDGEGNEAIVGRHGLLTMRIAMVLTALRKWEAGWNMKDVTCSDEDFNITIELVKVLLEHSLSLSTILPGTERKRSQMTCFHRVLECYKKLPESFTYMEYLTATAAMDISRSTAKRWLKKMLKQNLVAYDNGIYRKVHSTE